MDSSICLARDKTLLFLLLVLRVVKYFTGERVKKYT